MIDDSLDDVQQEKKMSVKILEFKDGGLVWMKFRFEKEKLIVREVDGREWQLDRSQAYLLMLYLQEHLK